ncbi:MAG: hypothetical protein H6765_02105 [Candidatus Peribacteria bacterium]|nr:MAG: hypothetical protein H6765_02105 [Candidatus Peribacteria bacterium]
MSGQAEPDALQLDIPANSVKSLRISVVPKATALLPTLQKQLGNRYVISTAKPRSQELFELAIKQGLHETYTILAENIT